MMSFATCFRLMADSEFHASEEGEHVLRGERVEWSNVLERGLRLYHRSFQEELEVTSATA
jgi:hypothetical protein